MKRAQKIFLNIFVSVVAVCILFACVGCSKNDSKDLSPSVMLAQNDEELQVPSLTNANATAETKNLYDYICTVYKQNIISGQQESTGIAEDYEFDYIFEHTGKYPAIRGLDFINDDFEGVVERAKKWAHRGGIVTICWHCSSNFDKGFTECQADKLTDEQWEQMLTEGTPEYRAMLAGMDKAGNALLELQREGIPVLWRPFHEFDGNWFWWGKGENANEHLKAIWKIMYRHFTDDLGLNNLIWVLGYSFGGGMIPNFYPGDEYCDIIGADSYLVNLYGAENRLYKKLVRVTDAPKPIVFHETGLIPTVEQFKEVPWAYFMTWHTTYLIDENTVEALNALYNDPYVITLDDLPAFYSFQEHLILF